MLCYDTPSVAIGRLGRIYAMQCDCEMRPNSYNAGVG